MLFFRYSYDRDANLNIGREVFSTKTLLSLFVCIQKFKLCFVRFENEQISPNVSLQNLVFLSSVHFLHTFAQCTENCSTPDFYSRSIKSRHDPF